MPRKKFTITTHKRCYLYSVHPEGHPRNGVLTKSMVWAEIVMAVWGMWMLLSLPRDKVVRMQRLRTSISCNRDPATFDALITAMRLDNGC